MGQSRPEKQFVFDNGEMLLFEDSKGRTRRVMVIRCIRTHECPAYLVCLADDPFGRGYEVRQSFLRRDVFGYAKQNSPAYVHR